MEGIKNSCEGNVKFFKVVLLIVTCADDDMYDWCQVGDR